MFYAINLLLLFLLLSGCSQTVDVVKVKRDSHLFESMDSNLSSRDAHVLYFQKSKDKKYYQQREGSYSRGWIDVDVPTHNNKTKSFQIMASPVSTALFYKRGGSHPVVNISYSMMNDFCIKKMHGLLVTPYLFDAARVQRLIHKPTDGITNEIIAPVD